MLLALFMILAGGVFLYIALWCVFGPFDSSLPSASEVFGRGILGTMSGLIAMALMSGAADMSRNFHP